MKISICCLACLSPGHHYKFKLTDRIKGVYSIGCFRMQFLANNLGVNRTKCSQIKKLNTAVLIKILFLNSSSAGKPEPKLAWSKQSAEE